MTYHIWYKEPKGEEFKIARVFGDTALEDKLIDMRLCGKPVYLILKEGKAMTGFTGNKLMYIKQTISCPHCGGVDAHRVDCKGGYGL